ncbi:MAG TPA: YciI family protein [Acidimicrobiales bacterium]|nr:YciI family protein [Acidimicrobiales bacterium]
MRAVYLVVEGRVGPEWEPGVALESQAGWEEHAAFMDALVARGFVQLGGPLEDGERVLLVVEAADEHEVRSVLADDPWTGNKLVVSTIERWTIRLDPRGA